MASQNDSLVEDDASARIPDKRVTCNMETIDTEAESLFDVNRATEVHDQACLLYPLWSVPTGA